MNDCSQDLPNAILDDGLSSPSDEFLLEQVRNQTVEARSAEEELVKRYARLVRVCARPFFLTGWDSEDFIQEGMLGLIRSVRDYECGKSPSFAGYAELCIRRQLYTAVTKQLRDKQKSLNNYISLNSQDSDTDADSFVPDKLSGIDLADDSASNVEAVVVMRDEVRHRLSTLESELSKMEDKVLRLYLAGYSMREIADQLARTAKSVENAIFRIRRKAQQLDPDMQAWSVI